MIKPLTKKKIAFYTFGCRLNQAETAIIRNSFRDAYEIVGIEEPADIVVINTCTVTENGDADTRHLVSKINRLNPQTRIALIGCQAQVQKKRLADLPNVYWVVGNAKKFDLASILEETENILRPQVITPTISRHAFTIPIAGIDLTHTRANLKIQDGCDFFCSFCEIPYARGRARSREFNDILKEAHLLAKAGHQEVVLTGINIGTYSDGGKTIIDVIDALEEIDLIKRIRISSIEPTTIPMRLIDKMVQKSKLCRYVHIPLQSGHKDILKKMERKYTVEEFSDFVQMAFAKVPDICIGTDVIVGFPGEEEKEFSATYELLRELPIHYFHVFSYSKRMLAKSRLYKEEVSVSVIQKRSEILRNLSHRKRRLFYESQLEKIYDVLFENKKNGFWVGLTANYIRVCAESHQDLSNTFISIRLKTINGSSVVGEFPS